MTAHITITPPANLALDAAQLQRADDLDARGGYWLMEYIGGALITMGLFSSPRDAMSRSSAGGWIEFEPRRWRSLDGRQLVAREFKPSERVL